MAEVPEPVRPGGLCVIVVAAGRSTRFGGVTKKVFAPLAGRAVFLHCLETLRSLPATGRIVLGVSAEDAADVRSRYGAELSRLGVGPVVEGGAERRDTVLNCLRHADPAAELIAVHDAARPLVSPATAGAVVRAAAESGAALAAEPAVATVKRSRPDGTVAATLPRNEIWLAQTPQVFRRELLMRAYAEWDGRTPVTDDAELVERLGAAVRLIAPDGPNFKITAAADLTLAEAWLSRARPAEP